MAMALLLFSLTSCDNDVAEENKPLEWSCSSSVEPSFSHGDDKWYPESFDLTFNVNQEVLLSYRVNYMTDFGNDQEHTYGNGVYYSTRGSSVSVHCDEDCFIEFYVQSENETISVCRNVWFSKLDKVSVSYNYSQEQHTEGSITVLSDPYSVFQLSLEVNRLPEWMGAYPVIRYTTDGSDPHDSDTVLEFATTRETWTLSVPYSPSINRIRAYPVLENWLSSGDTDVSIEVERTANPVTDPDGEGEIVLDFGESVTVSGEGKIWYTTNPNLSPEDVDEDSWEMDPASGWVRYMYPISIPENDNEMILRLVAREEYKAFSEIVEKSFRLRLPEPSVVSSEETSEGKLKVTFSRQGGPEDSIVKCIVDGITQTVEEEGNGQFSIIVNSGSDVTVYVEKTGFVSSRAIDLIPMIKLDAPVPREEPVASRKFKRLYLDAESGVTVCYLLNGQGKVYDGYIDIRETTTITFWAEKEGYEKSDEVVRTVTITYDLGDVGPSGGVIVHDKGTYSSGWRYIELANTLLSNQIFGYYAKKDGAVAESVGTSDYTGMGMGEDNTILLATIMSGHAYAGREDKIFQPKVQNKVSTFAALAAASYSKTINLRDRTVVYDGWYLPSVYEIQGVLTHLNYGEIEASWLMKGVRYWSSNEDRNTDTAGSAYVVAYGTDNSIVDLSVSKSNKAYVMMLRKF